MSCPSIKFTQSRQTVAVIRRETEASLYRAFRRLKVCGCDEKHIEISLWQEYGSLIGGHAAAARASWT
jgi:hypothetical protein